LIDLDVRETSEKALDQGKVSDHQSAGDQCSSGRKAGSLNNSSSLTIGELSAGKGSVAGGN